MSVSRLIRTAVFVAVALALIVSVIGVVLTGPIVARTYEFHRAGKPSAEALRRDVRTLCEELSPRDYLHPENLDRAAGWIAAGLAGSGFRVEQQPYTLSRGTFQNVVARRAGRDPAAGVVVIGAHYDAAVGTPGADDNASGVAVLMELARTLPRQRRPRRTLYLVAFGTEEPPFFGTDEMGSYRFARSLVDDDVEVVLMLSLDLVGYYTTEPGSQRVPFPGLSLYYPDRGDFVAVVGDMRSGRWIAEVKRGLRAADKLHVRSFRAPASLAPVHESDHLSFRRLGLPGVLVTDTAYLRYAHYHAPTDTPEKLDYDRMSQLVTALQGVLWPDFAP